MPPNLTLNVGLRYEIDTDVKNISGYGDINPIVQPFLQGDRDARQEQLRRRASASTGRPPTASTQRPRRLRHLLRPHHARDHVARARPRRPRAADRGARGQRVLPRPDTGPACRRSRRRLANPFTGFILPGAGASAASTSSTTRMQNPTVQQFNLGVEHQFGRTTGCVRVDGIHAHGTHFIIGRTIGDGLQPRRRRPRPRRQPRVERRHELRRAARQRRAAVRRGAWAAARPTRWPRRSTTPTTTRFRSRTGRSTRTTCSGVRPDARTTSATASRFAGIVDAAVAGLQLSAIWTLASGVPMDILMPDAQHAHPRCCSATPAAASSRPPGELNAYIRDLNAQRRRSTACRCRSCATTRSSATRFNSLDLRVSRPFTVGRRARIEPIVECFNVFNVTNILGVRRT